MARGGKREGSGRKRVIAQGGTLSKGMAARLFQDETTLAKWREMRNQGDHWFHLAVEKYIWDRAEGKPVQPMIQDVSPLEHLAERIEQARARVKQAK